MKEVYCRRCGGVLTSPRSRNHRTGPIGQRCWREERGLPPLPYQRKSAIDEVPFTTTIKMNTMTGKRDYVQTKLGDWD